MNKYIIATTVLASILHLISFYRITGYSILDCKKILEILLSIKINSVKGKINCSFLNSKKIYLTKKERKIIKNNLQAIIENKCLSCLQINRLYILFFKYEITDSLSTLYYFKETKKNIKIEIISSISIFIFSLFWFSKIYLNVFIYFLLYAIILLIYIYQFLLYYRFIKSNFGNNYEEAKKLIHFILNNKQNLSNYKGKKFFNNDLEEYFEIANEIYTQLVTVID